jgi:hypothetical protein
MESVVNTASMPHSKLNKRHNCLSYHKTRCWFGTQRFSHIPGPTNPADILSKHWDMRVLANIASLPFALEEKKIPPIDAIKMLIKQGKHKVANVLATEGSDTRSIPSTNDRDTTQVRELKDGEQLPRDR